MWYSQTGDMCADLHNDVSSCGTVSLEMCAVFPDLHNDVPSCGTVRLEICAVFPDLHNDVQSCGTVTDSWRCAQFALTYMDEIEPSVEKPPEMHVVGWWDQVVCSRCYIGHWQLTHAFLLMGEPLPECIGCQSPLTFKHMCWDLGPLSTILPCKQYAWPLF